MKRSRSSARALAISLKPVLARTGVIALFCLSLGLIVLSRSHNATLQNMRAAFSDTVAPITYVLSKPADAASAAGRWVSEMVSLREDNIRLTQDNERLRQWQAVASQLALENEKLRALTRLAPSPKSSYSTARVAADTGSPYSRSIIINSGLDQGIGQDWAVTSDAGLVGRVVDVGRKTARVLLLTDMNSRIPVIGEDSRERAIAGGNNSDTLSLIYLPETSRLKVGEKIVTAGDGGVLPPGLPVGVVTRIDKDGIRVKPYADGYHLDYVSVIDFSR